MHKYFLIVSCLVLASCSGIKINVNDNNNFNPSENSAYAWLWEPIKNSTGRVNNDAIFDRVLRKQLDQRLSRKGYQKSDKASADFLVSYTVLKAPLGTIDASKAATADPTKAWVGSRNIGANTMHRYESMGVYEQGSLMIILEDRAGKVLWQGAVTKLIEYQEIEEGRATKAVDKSLKKLLVHLPSKRNL